MGRYSFIAIAILLLGLLAAYHFYGGGSAVASSASSKDWVSKHWLQPLAPQSAPPEGFSALEASLQPEDCGTCHEEQFEKWSTARHSKAMGFGITSQLHSPWLDSWGQLSCQNCHAPLHEQKPFTLNGGQKKTNPAFDKKLQGKGVVCAACHVRNNKRYGPPPRHGNKTSADSPHGGFTVVKDFNRSEFCAVCHQFKDDQRRVKGKLIEDTYNQWEKSPAAAEGKQCASCHMPDREHSWKGIHSPEMVKKGVTIKMERVADTVEVTITNSGVGHKFPTYVTPRLLVTGVGLDEKGNEVGKEEEHGLGWYISLDLQEEYYDSRIDPGKSMVTPLKLPKNGKAVSYLVRVTVYPDEFYNRFFKALLENLPDGIDRAGLEKALEETENSSFMIFEKMIDLK